RPLPDLPSLGDDDRDTFGSVLTETLARLEDLFDPPMPYMFHIHQRPFDGQHHPGSRLFVELVGPHRSPGVMRYVGAVEVGSGRYLNPVAPDEAAANLRAVDLGARR